MISRLQIPSSLEHQILFLPKDTWVEPENFRTWPQAKRTALYQELRHECVAPQQNNSWVWFGNYNATPPYHARHYQLGSVQRALYKLLVEPNLPDNKRLTNHFTYYASDVNPYQCTMSAPRGMRQSRNLRKQRSGASIAEGKLNLLYTRMTEEGYDALSGGTIRMILLSEDYNPATIEALLTKMGKEND